MPKQVDPLYLRGGIWWCRVRGRGGRAERRSTGCKDKVAARIEWQNLERQAVDQDYGRAAQASFAQCVVDYFADLGRRRVSAAYLEIAQRKCGQLARHFDRGDLPMSRVDSKLVHEYIDKRQGEGVTDFTVKMELSHLKQVIRLARHHGKFHLDVDRVMPPFFRASPRRITRAPTQAEVALLVAQLEPRRGAHVAFICATGARLGESIRARRQDVGDVVVKIRGTKTDASAADVPITSISRPTLEWAMTNAPGKDLLFHPWVKIGRDIKAACVRAGIDACTPNDLRRAFGTWHRQAGVSAEMVSKLLRHATDTLAQTTYARIDGAAVGAIVEQALLLAPKPVPDLYPQTAPTEPDCANEHTETPINAAPPREFESLTSALGRPIQSDGQNRRSLGTKLGLLRSRPATIVPDVYTQNRAGFPLAEAVANLACLALGVTS